MLGVASVAAHGPPRGSNSEHAPVHRPCVSVSVSGVAPDTHLRDGAAACAGLAGAHDQEEDAAVLLRDYQAAVILQRLRHNERVARLVLDVLRRGPVVIDGCVREVIHKARRRAPKRRQALIAVDAGLLGGIDQAIHETGVAIGDVPPVEYMSMLLRDLVRISTK